MWLVWIAKPSATTTTSKGAQQTLGDNFFIFILWPVLILHARTVAVNMHGNVGQGDVLGEHFGVVVIAENLGVSGRGERFSAAFLRKAGPHHL